MDNKTYQHKKVQKILVLGGGSAGLLAALTLKRRLPGHEVTVLRSPNIGIIGVGEGTALGFVRHLFDYLKIDANRFYREAEPTWKLGIRFEWGKRGRFYYPFGFEYANQWPGMNRPVGFYCAADQAPSHVGPFSALMEAGHAFARSGDGQPQIHGNFAFHLENRKLASWLETVCREEQVRFMEATVSEVNTGEEGIKSLGTDDGRKIRADLYIDASGFRSELLGKALEVPFISYGDSLFCDRAVVGGWDRTDEPVYPYTTSETMQAGWCWQIEHEHKINRGYVYSSNFISDDQAEAEFRQANPKITGETRVVRFRSGRYERLWEKNVVAVGNASGFVEPLEATALQVICIECRTLADVLSEGGSRVTPSLQRAFNAFNTTNWDNIRDFLAMHYKFNNQIESPFWQHCRETTPLGEASEVVQLYRENGPIVEAIAASLPRDSQFGVDGYLSLLIGMGVPHEGRYHPGAQEQQAWSQIRERLMYVADQGFTVVDALNHIRSQGVPM